MSENTNSFSSPTNPKMSPGLAKAITEGTLKFPEGQPEPTLFHCAVDDCGYKSYGEIAQKYHAKESCLPCDPKQDPQDDNKENAKSKGVVMKIEEGVVKKDDSKPPFTQTN